MSEDHQVTFLIYVRVKRMWKALINNTIYDKCERLGIMLKLGLLINLLYVLHLW